MIPPPHQKLQNPRHFVLHANTYLLLHLVYSLLRQAHRNTRDNSHRVNMCRGGLLLDVTTHRSAGTITIFRNHVRQHAYMYRHGKRHRHSSRVSVYSRFSPSSGESIDRSQQPVASDDGKEEVMRSSLAALDKTASYQFSCRAVRHRTSNCFGTV